MFFTITLTHYDSIPFRQTLCMCLLYYLVVSGGKEKGSFSSLSIYLGSYYTIEMIGSRYKSLEVYTKPWTQECAEETQTLSYRNERREKSLVVVTFLCMANVNWIVRGWFNIKSDKLPLAKDKISPKNCKIVKKKSYCFKTTFYHFVSTIPKGILFYVISVLMRSNKPKCHLNLTKFSFFISRYKFLKLISNVEFETL